MTVDDPTIAEVVATMTQQEKEAIFCMADAALRNRKGAAVNMYRSFLEMDETKKTVGYFLIGHLVESRKNAEETRERIINLLFLNFEKESNNELHEETHGG